MVDINFLLLGTLLAGFYMAWNIGANDVSNSMGTSVGSRAITLKQAILIAGVMEFLGAYIFGSRVTTTVAKSIVDVGCIGDPKIIAIGAFSAILGASIWISIATWKKLPVSTTHSIVGSMLGFGLVASSSCVNPGVLLKIVSSWIISPIVGAIFAFLIFSLVRRFILLRSKDLNRTERRFAILQVFTASYVAFSHGSNDVANAVGPIATALTYGVEGATIVPAITIPKEILVLGGLGIVVGLSTWGYRVIETIGKRVTEITPTRGFSAEFATASVVIAHSYLGIPISTTHTLVGSVIGVGMARGIRALNLKIIREIIFSWLVTVPIAAFISGVVFLIIV